MRNLLYVAVACIALIALPSCAYLVGGGSEQAITINSIPQNATVKVNGMTMGETPMVATLKRKEAATVTIELQGYETYTMQLQRGTNGWVWGNLVIGGLIGLIVDASTGAMYKLSPEQITAELSARDMDDVVVTEDGLYIFVRLGVKSEGLELLDTLQLE
jgi:hypothetical protein